MSVIQSGRPLFSPDDISVILREHYGFEGTLESLPGYTDQNFKLDAGEAGWFIVKISNPGEGVEVLELQNAALEWLSERWSKNIIPRIVTSRSGRSIVGLTGPEGESYRLRLLTFLDGQPLAQLQPRSEQLLHDLGQTVG